MAFKVLVVDDSSFYRRRVKDILNEDRSLDVVGEAKNGREAIELIKKLRPDVVTMDVEMPVMDGISAVRRIMDECPVPVIMFSSLTHQGAKATAHFRSERACRFRTEHWIGLVTLLLAQMTPLAVLLGLEFF